MSEVKSKGHLMAFIAFFMIGAVFCGTCKLHINEYNPNYAAAAIVFWISSLVILIIAATVNYNNGLIFEVLIIIFIALFGVFLQLYWNASYLVYLLYTTEWMITFSFLRKINLHILVAVQLVCLCFLTMTNSYITEFTNYSYVSIAFTFIALMFIDWIGCVLLDTLDAFRETNAEYERSLDDINKIVEAKHQDSKQATKAKSQFLSSMSHEIRTPINGILGMNEMILRECKQEEVVEYARDIKRSGNILLSLINDILDVSKVEAGKMELVPVKFEMYKVIDEVIGLVSQKIKDKGLKFEIDIDNTLPSGCVGDDVRIRQVLLNILNNAAKYTHEGRVTLSVSGKVENNTAYYTFSVRDTGIGIKPEAIKLLNQSFVRLDEEKNHTIEGTGLGITIVDSLLKLMGSELKVESTYGEGSNFFFTLALEVYDKTALDEARFRDKKIEWDKSQQSSDEQNDKNTEIIDKSEYPHVLVVDDNSVNLKVFKGVLKNSPVIVDTASSGKEAISLASRIKYKAIFMDHMMPEMDGIETVDTMKSIPGYLNANTPFIALTANAVTGARETFVQHGFDGFISKPFNADELIAFVNNIARK